MDWNYAVLPSTLLELKQFREKFRSQRITLAVTLQDVQIKTFTALTKYSFRVQSHKVTVLVYGILTQKVCFYLSFIILFTLLHIIHYYSLFLCFIAKRHVSTPGERCPLLP
jgi:hypothetical protein